ncbi:hypothetical protein B0H14DRAFT_2605460 [Mycena olivaceomarginata]|nr:hypothetical protein B0H14DRAFT_2605460 [Mycena olivaceomarginata]
MSIISLNFGCDKPLNGRIEKQLDGSNGRNHGPVSRGERVATGGGGGVSLLLVIASMFRRRDFVDQRSSVNAGFRSVDGDGHAMRQEMETTPRRVKRAWREAARGAKRPPTRVADGTAEYSVAKKRRMSERNKSTVTSANKETTGITSLNDDRDLVDNLWRLARAKFLNSMNFSESELKILRKKPEKNRKNNDLEVIPPPEGPKEVHTTLFNLAEKLEKNQLLVGKTSENYEKKTRHALSNKWPLTVPYCSLAVLTPVSHKVEERMAQGLHCNSYTPPKVQGKASPGKVLVIGEPNITKEHSVG